MRKLLAIAIFCISCTIVFAEDAIVGVFVHSPNIALNDAKEPVGPMIDYVKAAVKDMGYTPVFKVLPFPRLMSGLTDGEVDMSIGVMKKPEREVFAHYADKPSYTMRTALAFLAENKLDKINSIDDLKGMTIGFLTGATTNKFFENQSSVKFDLISGDDWLEKNLNKLLAGRVDAAMDQNAFSYLAAAKKMGKVNKIKVLPLPGDGIPSYVVTSKKSAKGPALLAAYNKVNASGKYNLEEMILNSLK